MLFDNSCGHRWRRVLLWMTPGALISSLLTIVAPPIAWAQHATLDESRVVAVAEGDWGTTDLAFVVSLSVPDPVNSVTVGYYTSDGTARSGHDYEESRGNVVFAPGETRKVVTVPVSGDRVPEGDETFFFNLGGSQAVATIVDDDPQISIGAITVTEGDDHESDATFVVTLRVPTAEGGSAPGGGNTRSLDVDYETADGTATSGRDYKKTTGTLHFSAGERSKIIKVPVFGDRDPERDETFFVNLLDPSRGQIVVVQGGAVVLNDDAVALVGEPPAASQEPGGPVPPGALPRGLRSITAAGDAVAYGPGTTQGYEAAAAPLNRPAVGTAGNPGRDGYWVVAADGGVFAYGDAAFLGSTGDIELNQPIVGMAATPSGRGYWLVASDGGVFSFGDARFHGSTGAVRLNRPIVGMAATPSGRGYWLVASDGGVFSFGDARFHGSTGAVRLNRPIVGMAATPAGDGYWMVASDGGIFAFGVAEFLGTTAGTTLEHPIVGMAATPSGRGYWLAERGGALHSFGDAPYYPPAAGVPNGARLVALSAR